MFTGLRNARDLSGTDPARVRAGRIYRSDNLTRLDEPGRVAFTTAEIRTVLDLRSPGEVSTYGHFHGGADYHNLPVLNAGEWTPYEPGAPLARYWADRYLELTVDAAAAIRQALTLLAGPQATPAVVHCAGGRDRTGVLSALILALLDVPDEAIAADYARSAATAAGNDPEYAETPAETMVLMLAALRERHGDITGYAHSIGLSEQTITTLRGQLAPG